MSPGPFLLYPRYIKLSPRTDWCKLNHDDLLPPMLHSEKSRFAIWTMFPWLRLVWGPNQVESPDIVRFSSHIVVPVSMKSKVVRLELITSDPNRTTMSFDRGFHYCRPDWEEFLLGPVLLQHFHSIPDWQQRLFMLYVPSVGFDSS